MYDYLATVIRVIDGDTLIAQIDHGMRIYSQQGLRLMTADMRGVDCPEMNDPDPALRGIARIAKARTASLLPIGTTVLIHTEKSDAWQRWLASVRLPDGQDLGELLLREGLATIYHRMSLSDDRLLANPEALET